MSQQNGRDRVVVGAHDHRHIVCLDRVVGATEDGALGSASSCSDPAMSLNAKRLRRRGGAAVGEKDTAEPVVGLVVGDVVSPRRYALRVPEEVLTNNPGRVIV